MSVLFTGKVTRQDLIIAGTIAVIIVVLVVVFFVGVKLPLDSRAEDIDEQIAATREELRTAKEIASNRPLLEAEVKRVSDMVYKFEERLPTRREIPQLYRWFWRAAEDAGVVVEKIDKQPEGETQTEIAIPYKFVVSGPFASLGKVINILEMGDRFVKVSNMNIGEEEGGVCEARFTLSTYLFVGEKSATSTPAKKVEQE